MHTHHREDGNVCIAQQVIKCTAYDEIVANPTVEQTIRVGSADVEMVVQAANNQV